MRSTVALVLCVALALPGCATTGIGQAVQPSMAATRPPDRATMADYVQRIPAGSDVRVDLADGRRLRGTLMRADATSVLVNPKTRVPEPPVEVAIDDVRAVEIQRPTGVGRVIAIGAAAGAAATLGVLLLLYAMLGGD